MLLLEIDTKHKEKELSEDKNAIKRYKVFISIQV